MRTTQITSFSKAVAAGTVAGGGPYLFVTVPLAVGELLAGELDISRSLYLATLPLIVALVLVLSGSVIVGIPTAIILSRRHWETLGRYVLIGATAGVLIPFVGLLLMGGEWDSALAMGILGAFSGSVTAFVWAKAN